MLKRILPVLLALTVLLTACGPQGTPTMSSAEVEGTAVSAAWTMVAMTQAAIPTATPVPPTETPSPTPLPTFTPLPLPTQEALVLPTATQAGGDDNCLKTLNVAEAGPQSNVRFENRSGGKVTLSLNLGTNAFGQCGTLVYYLDKNEYRVISIPKGDYFGYAWITYANGDTSSASGYFVNKVGDDHLYPVVINKESLFSK